MLKVGLIIIAITILGCIERSANERIVCNPINERQVLIDLYIATNGQNWRRNANWANINVSICEWYGVNCGVKVSGNESFTYVSSLLLDVNNLTGTIPLTIGSLTHLQILGLEQNEISGTIPPTIGCLNELEILLLGQNELTGSIPETISMLTSIQHLSLQNNHLTGSIPADFTSLLNLNSVTLASNMLSGTLPSSIGNMKNLKNFAINLNQITGSIPPSIVEIEGLLGLALQFNRFCGPIPPFSSKSSLTSLYLQYNNLTGEIPPSLFEIQTLKVLDLSGNILSGTLPSSLAYINLAILDLSQNLLEGEIPFISSPSLKFLDLSTNGFTGRLPGMGGLTSIILFDLSGNNIGGELPQTPPINNIHLKMVDVSSNALTGVVPDWLSKVKDATVVLSYNEFICPYPSPLPINVNLQTDCFDNVWYRGLCIFAVIVLELIGFTVTIVGLTLAVARLIRPSAFSFLNEKNFELSYLKRRDEKLFKYLLLLRALCTFEMLTSLLMVLLGLGMNRSPGLGSAYSNIFLLSIPIVAVIFLFKSIAVMIVSFKQHVPSLIFCIKTQIVQLVFVWWSVEVTMGIAQSNTFCVLYFLIILLDTTVNIISMVTVYYIQNQFIPHHCLEFENIIGRGVYGEVWNAKYLGASVTVKRSRRVVGKNLRKEMYALYLHHAQLLSKVCHHPNIEQFVGISSHTSKEFFIVTKSYEGGPALDYLIAYRSLHNYEEFFRAVIKICMGVCDAMHYLHSNSYTHRTLTISSIMIKRGKGVVGEFGLAVHDNENENEERAVEPLLCPPEVKNGQTYCKSSDVYQFGILMWEMLMLRKWSKIDLLNGHSYALSLLKLSTPAALVKIIARCWNEEPDLRPKFWELLEDLSRLNQFESTTYRVEGEALGYPMGIINM